MIVWLPRERYFLPILPLLFYALWRACVWALHLGPRPVGRAVFRLLLVLLVAPNLVQCCLFVRQQHSRPMREGVDGPDQAAMRRFASRVAAATTERDLIVTAAHDRELSYFARRRVVSPPSALRLPPTPAQWDAFARSLATAPRVFLVLPDDRQRRAARMIEDLRLTVGASMADVPRPPGSRPPGPWSLHPVRLPDDTPAPAGAASGPAE
jgi:hypothetical protein